MSHLGSLAKYDFDEEAYEQSVQDKLKANHLKIDQTDNEDDDEEMKDGGDNPEGDDDNSDGEDWSDDSSDEEMEKKN